MTRWEPDPLLPGYFTHTIDLANEPTFAHEPEESLVATLVRRGEPGHRRAVLYVHGWSDYFFQTHSADAFDALGYDFFALDLRRYGRSLRTGQLAGFIPDLLDYSVELDAAIEIIRARDYDSVVLYAHSTGGLIAALYADTRPGIFSALVLNAPWIEFAGSPLTRPAAHPLMSAVSAVSPTTALTLSDNRFYHRSISAEEQGEWHFDPLLKGNAAFRVRVGWLTAVMSGQARVAKGLDIDCPVLVVTSRKSVIGMVGGVWRDEVLEADAVLDVERIADRVRDLGNHVTLVRIPGALHDVTLSPLPVRERVFDEYGRFLRAYA